MGSYLSTLTSCATARTASITLSKIPTQSRASPGWTSATQSTCRLFSSSSGSVSNDSLPRNSKFYEEIFCATDFNENHLDSLDTTEIVDERLRVEESNFLMDDELGRGRGNGSSTASTSTTLQRDFDGEGYKEDADSIVETIDMIRRDILLTTTTTTTIVTTNDWKMRDSSSSSSTSKFIRQASTRSSKVQSGKWDSSCDEII